MWFLREGTDLCNHLESSLRITLIRKLQFLREVALLVTGGVGWEMLMAGRELLLCENILGICGELRSPKSVDESDTG